MANHTYISRYFLLAISCALFFLASQSAMATNLTITFLDGTDQTFFNSMAFTAEGDTSRILSSRCDLESCTLHINNTLNFGLNNFEQVNIADPKSQTVSDKLLISVDPPPLSSYFVVFRSDTEVLPLQPCFFACSIVEDGTVQQALMVSGFVSDPFIGSVQVADFYNFQSDVVSTVPEREPEPSTLLLFGAALLAIVLMRNKLT